MRHRTFLILIVGVLTAAVWRGAALAASPELYLKTTAAGFAPGSTLTVAAFVSTTQPVNAYDIEIGYSAASLELVDSNSADSIVDIWKDGPTFLESGIIRIRGGSIRPFSGRAGELVKLDFLVKPVATGTLQWSFRRSYLYAADGKGTELAASWQPLIVPVLGAVAPAHIVREIDREPPVFLVVKATENPIDGSWFATWLARDDTSGVRSTHLRVRRWFLWEPWQTAVNPVRLPNGTWAVELRVTDGAGNSAYHVTYLPRALAEKAAGTALALVVIASIVLWFSRRRGAVV